MLQGWVFSRTKQQGRKRWAIGVGAVALAALLSAGQLSLPARAATGGAAGYDPSACGGAPTPPSHVPIAIVSDADWTAANGVSAGSGTPSDPYIIGCLAIQVGAAGTGISVGSFASDRAFVIRDLTITGASGAQRTNSYGVHVAGPSRGSSDATVEASTVSNVDFGISASGFPAAHILGNLLTANTTDGIQVSGGPSVVIDANVGTANRTCILLGGGGQVTHNSCTNGGGDGFFLSGSGNAATASMVASGNVAQQNRGNGYFLEGGVAATNNTSQANNNGFFLFGSNLMDANQVGGLGVLPAPAGSAGVPEGNRAAGIDMSGATGSTITNNVIVGNAGFGIVADPASSNGSWDYASVVSGNHIGANPYGIVFSGIAAGNEVWGTDWTDGHQAIIEFADQNTIIDAGSAKRALANAGVNFDDYIARVTLGNGPPPPGASAAGLGTRLPTQLSVETGITWNFGDGSPEVAVIDPAQGHGPPPGPGPSAASLQSRNPLPPVSHAYAAAGSYIATLTVSGINSAGQPVSLSDTVGVTIS